MEWIYGVFRQGLASPALCISAPNGRQRWRDTMVSIIRQSTVFVEIIWMSRKFDSFGEKVNSDVNP
jgi:hypothetical protein